MNSKTVLARERFDESYAVIFSKKEHLICKLEIIYKFCYITYAFFTALNFNDKFVMNLVNFLISLK